MNSQLDTILDQIASLGLKWHGAGTVSDEVLRAIIRLAPQPTLHSAETGTGRSSLLLSNLSKHHVVFTRDDRGDGDSLHQVQTSPLLYSEAVEFVLGPTQQTLLTHAFSHVLDLVLIDGPHAFPYPELEYYYLDRHVRPGGLLIVDDIQIPSIRFMFRFLSKDDMWRTEEVVGSTAFFTRTEAPPFDPLGDGWWLQGYNKAALRPRGLAFLRAHAPMPIKALWRAIRPRE